MPASDKDTMLDDIISIYAKIGAPLAILSTIVGLGSSLVGELEAKTPNQPLTVFVNITGSTFIGLMSGLFWPVTMPILSIGAIYNKMFR
jgi:hypothetical protein